MKGGNGLIKNEIKNEEELKKSWENKSVQSWMVNDGVGTMMTIFREDATTHEKMPYGTEEDNVNMSTFRGKINYYLKKVIDGEVGAKIEEMP